MLGCKYLTMSRIACAWSLPLAPSARGGKAGVPSQLLSQREQSEPGVPGHGTQGPPMHASSPGRHRFGVVAVSLGPGMQRGPRAVEGIGIMAHSLPSGYVPSEIKVPCIHQ